MGGSAVRAVLLLVFVLSCVLAGADGMYIGKTYTAKPTIPDQRAIVVWHDGIETLLVESKLRAEAGEYSWVVPLPSVPIEVAKARPSVMDLSFGRFDPIMRRPNPTTPWAAKFVFAGVLVAALLSLAVRKVTSRLVQALVLTIGSALAFVLYPVFAPSLDYAPKAAGGMNGAENPVQILSRKTVGSYEVSVIRSAQATALVDWLDKEGTPLPPQAEPVVKSYLDEGWCFVAAKLRKSETEDLMPHPLRIRFKTEEPVYPMRLTGLVSDRLELDLLVIGQQEASCSSLDLWRSMKVSYSGHATPEDLVYYSQLASFAEIRHADLAPYLPGNAVGTRLRRTLSASEMKRDFRFEWQPISDPQPEFKTATGIRYEQESRGFWTLAALVFVGTFLSIVTRWKSLIGHLGAALGMVVLSVGVAGISTRELKTVELAQPNTSEKVDAGIVWQCIDYAVKRSREPGFDPFPVRFERALASRRAYLSGRHDQPNPEPRPQDLAAVREWNRDEVAGYQLRKLRENAYEVQVINTWGEITRHQIRDRAPTKVDAVVETTIRIVATPSKLVEPARRAGIIPDWNNSVVRFVRSDGKAFRAWHVGNGVFRAVLPSGEFHLTAYGRARLWESVRWGGKETLSVPFQRQFSAEGKLDLSEFFVDGLE